ncbi:hypothetical protein ACKF11_13325 [Methylobacillus sp. Pita2]|uniref:hypothetical protein n=1 Tax=Methylobacillus sp. Pita2 TaxID=3383245 RepID=UPI0038B62A7F
MDLDDNGYISGVAVAWDSERSYCSLDSKFGLISTPDYPDWFAYPLARNPRMASLLTRSEVGKYLDAGFGNDLDLVTGYTLLDYLLFGNKVIQACLVMERCEESIAAPEIQKKLWDHFLPVCLDIFQNPNLTSLRPYVEEILYRLLRHETGNSNFDLACQHLLKANAPKFNDYFIRSAQAAHARIAGEVHTAHAASKPSRMRM